MALKQTPDCEYGATASPFSLSGTDGKTHTLDSVRGEKGTLILFICNHCPYVQAIAHLLEADAAALRRGGIGVAAVMSNDAEAYPEDGFEHMVRFAEAHGFTFPYLLDATQEVARAYGAVCTPDFFGYDAQGRLRYRGRLDATTPSRVAPEGAPRELVEAMLEVASSGRFAGAQTPAQGCSIKWRGA